MSAAGSSADGAAALPAAAAAAAAPPPPTTAVVPAANGGAPAGGDAVAAAAAAAAGDGSANPLRPTLQNIVATCNLAVELDLKAIALGARNVEYNPKRFSAVIMRIREPKTTALIFKSGKMVVTGAKSEEAARNAARLCK